MYVPVHRALILRRRNLSHIQLREAFRLWSGLLRVDGGGGGLDLEVQEPLAWHIAAVHLCGNKFPELGGFQRAVGKILAWSRRIEGCLGYVPGVIHVYLYTEPDLTADGVSGFLGRIGQDSVNDSAAYNAAAGCCRGRRGSNRRRQWSRVTGCGFFLARLCWGVRGMLHRLKR